MRLAVATLALTATLALAAATAHAASVTYDLQGTLGDHGWYVSPVKLTWHVAGTSTSGSCWEAGDNSITLHVDTAGKTMTCSAGDGTGTVTAQVVLKIDQTPPAGITAAPVRPPDANGWYSRPVAINWRGQDATSGINSCTTLTYAGPDAKSGRGQGRCRDRAGNESAPVAFGLRYDATAPLIQSATPEHPPDRDGWYLRPVTFMPHAVDATSGVQACPAVTYSGPDALGASTTATCTDRAGNVGTADVSLRYDATPPAFSSLTFRRKVSSLTLRWQASADTISVKVRRAPDERPSRVFAGPAGGLTDTGLLRGVRYAYKVTATDAAGNTTTRTIRSRRRSALLSPPAGARVAKPPLLRWRRVKHARYFNVQVFDGDRKLLSAWPSRNRLQLKRRWRYHGARRSLRSGARISWYVWPGFGERSQHRYGRGLGVSHFRMK